MIVSPDKRVRILISTASRVLPVSPQRGHKATQQSISFLQLFLFPVTQHFHPEWDEKRGSCFMQFAFFPIYYLLLHTRACSLQNLVFRTQKHPFLFRRLLAIANSSHLCWDWNLCVKFERFLRNLKNLKKMIAYIYKILNNFENTFHKLFIYPLM